MATKVHFADHGIQKGLQLCRQADQNCKWISF